MNFFRRFRDVTIVVVLLALPFFFLRGNLEDPTRTNQLDKLVLQASAPVQWAASQAARGVTRIFEEYVYLVDVARDNERLRYENARLKQEHQALLAEAAENHRLRDLLQLREQLSGELFSARVIGKDISSNFRVIRVRLDRGERDRVEPGMPVVAPEGLVGQVQRTWAHYSDVRLTVDRTSAIDVVVRQDPSAPADPSRLSGDVRGILRGTGESNRYACKIQFLLRADKVNVGDLVLTSGLGQRFPPNILVGRVRNVVRQDFGLYQEVEVEPTVNFSSLEEVEILTQGARGQAEERESQTVRQELGARPNNGAPR